MNRLDSLMADLCPDGVKLIDIGNICDISRGRVMSKEYLSNNPGEYPVYSSQTANKGVFGYIDSFEYDCESLTWTTDGANAGSIFYHTGEKFNITNVCGLLKVKDKMRVDTRYLFYCLQVMAKKYVSDGMGNPKLMSNVMSSVKIPLPPLPIQREIVRILDNFTELTEELMEELTEELAARKKQYEYYRDELLTFEDDVPTVSLFEIANFRRGSFPQPYGNREWYDGDGAMPFVQVADVGENMRIVENTKRKISKLAQEMSVFVPAGTVIVTLQGSIGRVAITQYDSYVDRTLAVFQELSPRILKKYFAYQLQKKFAFEEKNARGSTIKTITKAEFTDFKIPLPSIEKQNHIIAILDTYEVLIDDISIGLPVEITARKKQYEYYRNKLLTFMKYN